MGKKIIIQTCDPNSGCCSPEPEKQQAPIDRIERRDFLKAVGLASGGVLFGFPALGSVSPDGDYTIPIDKGLSPEWYKSLYERGKPEIYSGKELAYVGMPIGGLCAGTVYLGGDGKLWLWDIFNDRKEGIVNKVVENWGGREKTDPRNGANYIAPNTPAQISM